MPGRVAVHATHEAADKLGGIGTVLAGLLPEPAYQAVFLRSLLVGPYLFPDEGNVIDDPALREARGWRVRFDSARPPSDGEPPAEALAAVAERFGVRLVYGERTVARGCTADVILASPQGVAIAEVDAYRAAVRERFGIDLAVADTWPAVTDRVDRRLERLLDPEHGRPDVPDQILRDAAGRPLPGGARIVGGRAEFPAIRGLDSFSDFEAANRYLLELQVHTFAAPALWAAAAAVLRAGGVDPSLVTLFCHDWVGVPLFWAARVAGVALGQTVYFAHEARIFRLLAEGALQDWSGVLNPVCHLDGHDASLYPYLDQAVEAGWDLERMFPGSGGFRTIPYHRLGREAVWFDKIVAVGRRVRDELRVALRPPDRPDIALCPNGIPSESPTPEDCAAARERLQEVAEAACGFRPDVIVTGVMRCELSKAPWRNVGLVRTLAERRPGLKIATFWLSAPRPGPTPAQVAGWAEQFGWPLDHRPAPEGDLRPDEEALWRAIARLNAEYAGRAALLYINQFGWGPGLLGALDPRRATFADLRLGTDIELGLSVYEPFGIAALEPYFAGAVCLLSDACGCALELEAAGAGETVAIGRFTRHDWPPADVDAARRRAIEQRVYEELVDAATRQLGMEQGPANAETWLQLRGQRIDSAARLRGRLSWAAAVERGLLPALGYAPAGNRPV